MQPESFSAKDTNAGSAYIKIVYRSNTCAKDVCIERAFTIFTYIKDTFIESLYVNNVCYTKIAYIGSTCGINTYIRSTWVGNIGAVKCLKIHL